ncbi:carboxymuconolactone decarboxylase family protein [Cytobacillus spongiae]|jgi:4-carboxymuconolactone decarboxylase|uniref:carboxymuconolactone decarboxylase family protein n=1 Tax=Cytobacillus spongiae TaxID=2901381 RepID=UPI001F17D0F7|nr:carboxymuconolactone decarboxylase family protein [Cytobacillus spongiae]UII55529.1 carboxymuconolactone decarboxylase family protein [Cytobacillus spongiae]
MKEELKSVEKLAGKKGVSIMKDLQEIFPDLGELATKLHKEIYERNILDLKQQEIITLAVLISQGNTESAFRFHINAALHAGLSKEEILEIIFHCAPYTGFPKAINAVYAAYDIFVENGLSS